MCIICGWKDSRIAVFVDKRELKRISEKVSVVLDIEILIVNVKRGLTVKLVQHPAVSLCDGMLHTKSFPAAYLPGLYVDIISADKTENYRIVGALAVT